MNQEISKEAIALMIEHIHDKEQVVSAIVVVKSLKTSTDFTYKLKAETVNGYRQMKVGIEIEYDRYNYVYSIRGIIATKIDEDLRKHSPVYAGAIWLLEKIHKKQLESITNQVEIYHTGRCVKCNRKLTDLISIQFGMGKTCRNG